MAAGDFEPAEVAKGDSGLDWDAQLSCSAELIQISGDDFGRRLAAAVLAGIAWTFFASHCSECYSKSIGFVDPWRMRAPDDRGSFRVLRRGPFTCNEG